MDYNLRTRAFYASQGWEQDAHHRPDNPALLGYRLAIPGKSDRPPILLTDLLTTGLDGQGRDWSRSPAICRAKQP